MNKCHLTIQSCYGKRKIGRKIWYLRHHGPSPYCNDPENKKANKTTWRIFWHALQTQTL